MSNVMRVHKYQPFTTRNGSSACSQCDGTINDVEHVIAEHLDEVVTRTNDLIGTCVWDMVDHKELVVNILTAVSQVDAIQKAVNC